MASKHKMILFEVNEIPFRILDDYVAERPRSHLAELLATSKQLSTVCEDQVELDPWISWPTLHRGVIDEEHQILHLGQSLDVAEQHYPPIWRLLSSQGVKVGVMGSLHSSSVPDDVDDYAFYVPDFFAHESFAHPPDLVAFQQFNLLMTRKSARNVDTALPLRSAGKFLRYYTTHGLSRTSVQATLKELLAESFHRHLRCRRRSIQPLISLDVFLHLMHRTRPDFATLYTNHVAAAMHRYWAAAYPDDPGGTVMPDDWRRLYKHEITYAMDCLDLMLGRLVKFAKRNDYMLLVCGSMGQAAHKSEATSGFVTIVDLEQFMTRMGLSRSHWTERYTMAPCVSVTVDPRMADAFEERLRSISCDGKNMVSANREVPPLSYDRSSETFHLFVYFERYVGQRAAEFAGAPVPFEWLGWGFHEHQDNIDCSARHTPHGLLLVYNPGVRKAEGNHRAPISTLDIAPTLLDYFGLPVPSYMHPPDPKILDPAAIGTDVAVTALGGGVEEPVKREVRR
ncbi:hypothetical protein Mycsm_00927 [Mycobacterium sp. JS623]|uniref:hypothetical protein n=1 Tax=Mycobacterium sp. JS623 TaxID=212767 RepID=UPI0002A58334|nr:hypothetical protein [Mycobacterium sp. JS623]AGB21354.1 hypothetical protein Mycsm_00927 [Mycobacterium sp. JS623]